MLKMLNARSVLSVNRMMLALPMRQFSLVQNELEKHDFTDVLNITELKLKSPEKKEKMNLF
jgi:hypothetical protein